jgi:hypothetical protein
MHCLLIVSTAFSVDACLCLLTDSSLSTQLQLTARTWPIHCLCVAYYLPITVHLLSLSYAACVLPIKCYQPPPHYLFTAHWVYMQQTGMLLSVCCLSLHMLYLWSAYSLPFKLTHFFAKQYSLPDYPLCFHCPVTAAALSLINHCRITSSNCHYALPIDV